MAWIPDPNRALVLFKRVRRGENLVPDAAELFWAFFTNAYPPEEFHERMDQWRQILAENTGEFTDKRIAGVMAKAVEDHDFAVQTVTSELDELAEQITPPYAPDGVGDDPEMLAAALYIQATRLVRTVRLQDFGGDDVREAFQRVVGLRSRLDPSYMETRLKVPGPLIIGSVNSETEEEVGDAATLDWLIARVGIELAVQSNDYQEAFRRLGKSLDISLEFGGQFFGDLLREVPDYERWDIREISGKAFDRQGWVAGLDRSKEIDWEMILTACEDVKFTPYAEHTEEAQFLQGWIASQLTPDQLRSLYDNREDRAAEHRLQTYFFTDEPLAGALRPRKAGVDFCRPYVRRLYAWQTRSDS